MDRRVTDAELRQRVAQVNREIDAPPVRQLDGSRNRLRKPPRRIE